MLCIFPFHAATKFTGTIEFAYPTFAVLGDLVVAGGNFTKLIHYTGVKVRTLLEASLLPLNHYYINFLHTACPHK